MAFRFGIGKFRLKGFGLPKWGVRGSLFAAFAVIAGMAIVISAGAGWVLNHLGGSMVEPERTRHPAPCRQPAIAGAEREPCEPGSDAAGLAQRGDAEGTSRQGEGNPGRRDGQACRNQAARRRQGHRRQSHRDGEEHRRHDQQPRLGGARTARGGRPARQAVRSPAQGAGGIRRRLRAGDGGRPEPAQCRSQLGRSVDRRRQSRRAHRRAARQRDRQRQFDGIQHGLRPVRQHQRHAGSDRKGFQGDGRTPQIQSRDAAERRRRQDHGRGFGETAGARPGQGTHLQDPPEGARLRRLRPDHSGGNPQAQCRARHQRATARRRRAQGNRRRHRAVAAGNLLGDARHAGARRRDPDRIGAVRLALCRPQHPAPHARAAKLDEDPVERRSGTRRSTVPARATRSRKCRNRCRCSARA